MKPAYQKEYPDRGDGNKFKCCARCCFTSYEVSGSDYVDCMRCKRPLEEIERRAGLRLKKDRLKARAKSVYLRKLFKQVDAYLSTWY